MKITAVAPRRFHTLPYHNAGPRGRGLECALLPFLSATVDVLPPGLEALVLAADLQGREISPEARLLGERVCEELVELALAGHLPAPEATGVILAGDLYTVPGCAKRGGLGDVRSVWAEFTRTFRWTAGVAGNHDLFGDDEAGLGRYRRRGAGYLLDGDVHLLDGLRVAGVSGIVGNPRKPCRRVAEEFSDLLLDVIAQEPHVVVLHDGPNHDARGFGGNADIRAALEQAEQPLLVVRGHKPWPAPLARLSSKVQVVNAHEAVLVLQAESASST